MKHLTEEQEVYLTDDMYLPIQYKGIVVKEPFFSGNGIHSVAELERICEQYKEYCHQQAVIKHNCKQHIVELKFNIPINNIQTDNVSAHCDNPHCDNGIVGELYGEQLYCDNPIHYED